ncbi:MAG: SDR family oxidoreductase [Myxococcales bacterium]|nr:SDR family oxidoreductase [Myxococcales bacterium]
MILEGKTLIVTGVGTGLGSEVVRAAHRDGANVVLAARTQATLDALAKEVDPSGKRIEVLPTDINDEAQCAKLVEATLARFGKVDALAQVAATQTLFGNLDEVSAEDLRLAMETNVIGSLLMSRAASQPMRESGGGSIVLIGSQSSFLPLIPQLAYASSKGALMTAMYFMAKDLGPHRIRVNTVVPTWMWGPPVEGYLSDQAKERGCTLEDMIAEVTSNFCIPEIPEDGDVAEAVIFLASDRARMITGQYLMVNAGERMT